MKLPRIKKKFVVIGVATGLAMGAAGIAAAYFSATGSGTGSSNVGHPTSFTVTQQNGPVGTMYPDNGTSKQLFNITNTGNGVQHYTVHPTGATITTTGGYVITSTTGTAVTPTGTGAGCKASWFSATVTPTPNALSGTLTPGERAQVTVTVTMDNGTTGGSTQNTCQGTHPRVTLHVAS